MAWQQTDLDALDQAIALGWTEVRYADGSLVRYQDVDKMLMLRTTMKSELSATAGRANPPLRTTIGKIVRW